MFNFLFIMLVAVWSVLFLYRFGNLVLGALKFIVNNCEDKENFSDAEEKSNSLIERIHQVAKVEDDFFNEICPVENAKSKKVKKAQSGLMLVTAVIAPIYAVIAILGLIF